MKKITLTKSKIKPIHDFAGSWNVQDKLSDALHILSDIPRTDIPPLENALDGIFARIEDLWIAIELGKEL